ncbi:MAG: demethoxyubiquinone hydroxylase family protein [Alphaproteobacteria bacterium]|nr:demethoxyubiquinone hydroxylase family protein [Alphaproteobacteria bacterium]
MPPKTIIDRMLRVNQAGEYGATRIYAGQLAVFGRDPKITHMAEQEQHHLRLFNQLLIEHKVRPTLLQPIWHIGGFALGMTTALLGKKAAHACTIAVETVIDRHYGKQLDQLKDYDHATEIKTIISQCQQEELEHKDMAIQQGGEDTPLYPYLNVAIQTISKAAIWLSSRI